MTVSFGAVTERSNVMGNSGYPGRDAKVSFLCILCKISEAYKGTLKNTLISNKLLKAVSYFKSIYCK